MRTTKSLFTKAVMFCLVFLLSGFSVKSQTDTTKIVKVKILKVTNGDTVIIDTTFSATDKEFIKLDKDDADIKRVDVKVVSEPATGDNNDIIWFSDGDMSQNIIKSDSVKIIMSRDAVTGDKNGQWHTITVDKTVSADDSNKVIIIKKEIIKTIDLNGDSLTETIIINSNDGSIIDNNGTKNINVVVNSDYQGGDTNKHIIILKTDDVTINDDCKSVTVLKSNNGTTVIITNIELNDFTDKEQQTLKSIGVSDINTQELKADELKFFPNPNDGKFELSFNLPEQGRTKIKIFDINGKEIFSDELDNFQGNYSKSIDISANPAGVYILQVQQNQKFLNRKIVLK